MGITQTLGIQWMMIETYTKEKLPGKILSKKGDRKNYVHCLEQAGGWPGANMVKRCGGSSRQAATLFSKSSNLRTKKEPSSKMLSSTSNHHQFTSLEGNYMGEPRRSPKSSPLNETTFFFRSRPWRQKRNIGEMKENLKPRRDSNKVKKQHKHEPPNAET